MDLGITGKTALVLGGGGGLGSAIAVALAREGANVALADIDEVALAATMEAVARFRGGAASRVGPVGSRPGRGKSGCSRSDAGK